MFSYQPSSLQISDQVEGSGLTQWKWSPSGVSKMLPSQLCDLCALTFVGCLVGVLLAEVTARVQGLTLPTPDAGLTSGLG